MKILIYGGYGWIGQQFVDILKSEPDVEVFFGQSRIENISTLEAEISRIIPTHVVCLVGRTHGMVGETSYSTIDYLETPGKLKENIRDNLYAPIILGNICANSNIHYTYFGTGCIFDSSPDRQFTEEDEPNFYGSGYSTVKAFTDRLIQKILPLSCLHLRIRMPISSDNSPRNFITKITTYEKICSLPNSMTVLPDLLPIAVKMMRQKFVGTFNFTNPGYITHNEILQMYKEIVDPSFTWTNFTLEEQSQLLLSQRSNNVLDTSKLESIYPIPDIKKSVYQIMIDIKKKLTY
jgi:dTDP-4-dehydrorhamnose reductase